MARGGARQGTPGVGYQNRTDLAMDRAPQQGTVTAAAGGQAAPAGPPTVPADLVPDLNSPTNRPGEPVTAGVDAGPGPGAGFTPQPPTAQDPVRSALEAIMLVAPSQEARAMLSRLDMMGR